MDDFVSERPSFFANAKMKDRGANSLVIDSKDAFTALIGGFIGSIIIVLIGLFVNNMRANCNYPVFWW